MSAHLRLLVVLGCLCLAGPALADVIYSQNFDDPDTSAGNGDALGVYDWAVHNGGTGQNSSLHAVSGNAWDDPVNSAATQARVVNDPGSPPSGSDRVFAFWGIANSGGQDLLFWTQDFSPINPAAYTDLAISWYHLDSGSTKQRAAVAINTGSGVQWYAADLKTNTSSSWVQATSALADAIWIPFTFDGTQAGNATAAFNVTGAAGSLAAGSVVAAGLYVELPLSTAGRFDSFEITGVIPEPASLALAALGGIMMVARRRRHT